MSARGVPCPHCNSRRSYVVDSRPRLNSVHRRRVCFECNYRYNTSEVAEWTAPTALRDSISKMIDQAKAFLEDTQPYDE